jgi:hypothetical protein
MVKLHGIFLWRPVHWEQTSLQLRLSVYLIRQCASGLEWVIPPTFSWQTSGSRLGGWANQAGEYMNMQISTVRSEGSHLFRSIALDLGFASFFFSLFKIVYFWLWSAIKLIIITNEAYRKKHKTLISVKTLNSHVRNTSICTHVIIVKQSSAIAYMSRVSSGSVVSGYGLDDRAIGVRSPAGEKDSSSSLCVQTGSVAHSASCTKVPGDLYPGLSAAGAWRWPLTRF